METKKSQLKKACCLLAVFVSFLFNSPVFSQGVNWKLNLNNNVTKNDGIGSLNYADLNFYTNGIKRFTITKDGNISILNNFAVAGKIIADSLCVTKSIRLGLHSFNWVPDVNIGGGVLSDQMRSTNGNITMGNDDVGQYGNIKVGIGKTNPGYTLDVNDDINLTYPLYSKRGYRIFGFVVLSIDSTNNTFVGRGAGLDNTFGSCNTFVGKSAGKSNLIGENNTMIGAESGYFTTTGSYNVFIGANAGLKNTTGESNTFVGYSAGYGAGGFNITGIGNSCFGRASGRDIIDGNNNSFFGKASGSFTRDGDNNSFFGMNSGQDNVTGSNNSFYGVYSGGENLGNNNSFFGFFAGYNNLYGSNNTYIGNQADGTADLTNATALGSEAKVMNSDNMILGNNRVRVGLGLSGESTGPQNNLEIRATDISGNPINYASGLTFTQLTSAFTPSETTTKVLTVNETGKVILANVQGGGADADADPTNELQTVSQAGNIVTLSNGGGNFTKTRYL